MSQDTSFEGLPPYDGQPSSLEIAARASRIEGLLVPLLDNPDWEQAQLHYQAPLGDGYRLELLARTSSESLGRRDERNIDVIRNDSENSIRISPLMINLNDFTEDDVTPSGLYSQKFLDEALGTCGPDDIVARTLVEDSAALRVEQDNDVLLGSITERFAGLLSIGASNARKGVVHTLPDETRVLVLSSKIEGDQPWEAVDKEPALQVRVQTQNRVVDFCINRDGVYETFDSNPDYAQEATSIYGETRVIKTLEGTLVFDLGDNDKKLSQVQQFDKAMGFRDPDLEKLEIVENALLKVLADRQY